MAFDNNLSPSAEVNGLKDNALFKYVDNRSYTGVGNEKRERKESGESLLYKMASSIRKTINPVKYERTESEIEVIRREAEAKAIGAYCKTFGYSPERAILCMAGYNATNSRTENAIEVLREVANRIPPDPDLGSVSDEFKDNAIEGAMNAYDENVRELWIRLIAGEITAPGSYSKSAVNILKNLDSEYAKLFETLCSLSFSVVISSQVQHKLLNLPEIKDEFPLSLLDMSELERLGLVTGGLTETISNPNGSIMVFIGEQALLVNEGGKKPCSITLSGSMLTRPGLELYRLCNGKPHKDAAYLFGKAMVIKGLSVSSVLKKQQNVS